MKPPKFEIIAGTYEEFLLGFHFISKQTELVQTFAIHEHSSSIRCVTTSGYYLASGAADDRIIIYNLKQRKEHCMLTHHTSTVNCLQFTNNHSHLISGSVDGELSIVRVGSWQLEKTWTKAHKGSSILDIAVHCSGKLALTLGSDCSLRTWNLVKGRQAYIINLNSKSKDAKSLNKIIWAEDGIRFILAGGKYTEIWNIETGGILKVIEYDEKICSCIWISEHQIIVGFEDGQIALVEVNNCTKNIQKAHSGRVKSLAIHKKWIVSASSTGEIKVWNTELKELSHYDTGCRITCLTIAESNVNVKEEKEGEILEVTEEKVAEKTVKKSSVVVEVEDSENDRVSCEVKTRQKQHEDMVVKKNKRKLKDNQVEESQKSQMVKVKQKKNKKQKIGLSEEKTVFDNVVKTKPYKNKNNSNVQKDNIYKDMDTSKAKKRNKQNK